MHQAHEVLSVEGIDVAYPGRHVLKGVDFRLFAGEFCGLIGANGSGKTTLLRTILGFLKPTRGTIRLGEGHARSGVAYVPQKISLDPSIPLRARDLVSLGLDGHRLGLPMRSRKRMKLVDAMIEAVDARAFADQRIGDLSGGQQQRILIAHALVRRPGLLLLDEPLANLDIRSVAEIVALLRHIAVEHRTGLLLSAHDMNPLLSSMDRIVYIANGGAVAGRTDDVVQSDVLSKLYGYPIDVIRVHGRVLVVGAFDDRPPYRAPEEIDGRPVAVES